MKLSQLQKHILRQCINSKGGKISKSVIDKFYSSKKTKPKAEGIVSIITKSVERLIHKELIIGFGKKTAHKWFIQEVKLTPKGKKIAKTLFGKQQKLPLKLKKKK